MVDIGPRFGGHGYDSAPVGTLSWVIHRECAMGTSASMLSLMASLGLALLVGALGWLS
jgi:hypothetical protein